MSETAPGDLAVAFRSIERRLREALEPVDGDRSKVARMLTELDQIVREAAAVVRTPADGASIAAAIEARDLSQGRRPKAEGRRKTLLTGGAPRPGALHRREWGRAG